MFFGRDDKIKEVLEMLERRRGGNAKGFVLGLGASRCGKSSLVWAGVLPWLKRASDKENFKGKWLILQPVMASRGMEDLATVLDIAFQKAGKPSDQPALRRRLSTSGKADSAFQALGERASALLAMHRIPDGLVLMVLDQLEEVFATLEDSQARAALRRRLAARRSRHNALGLSRRLPVVRGRGRGLRESHPWSDAPLLLRRGDRRAGPPLWTRSQTGPCPADGGGDRNRHHGRNETAGDHVGETYASGEGHG